MKKNVFIFVLSAIIFSSFSFVSFAQMPAPGSSAEQGRSDQQSDSSESTNSDRNGASGTWDNPDTAGDESQTGGGSGATPVDAGNGSTGGSNEPVNDGETQFYEDNGQLVECERNCGFEELMSLLRRIVEFLLITVAAPFAAIMFVWAGFLYMTSAGDPGKIKQAKDIFVWVVIGFSIALAAWLTVNALLGGLGVRDAFNFLN